MSPNRGIGGFPSFPRLTREVAGAKLRSVYHLVIESALPANPVSPGQPVWPPFFDQRCSAGQPEGCLSNREPRDEGLALSWHGAPGRGVRNFRCP